MRATAFAAVALLAIGVAMAGSPTDPAHVLVGYSFDDEMTATGPDTFAVYQAARGTVGLSSTFRLSGYRSVELRDVAGDGDFPELQGFFPRRDSGTLYAHFAFLTTDDRQEFNVALAGPRRFTNVKDGIAFRLQARDGILYHHSDSMPKRLFPLRAFVWYVVDLAYRIDTGTYDLVIREEGTSTPMVDRRDQPNAPHEARSAVEMFSFIGDPGTDESKVDYFVDDVVLSADRPVTLPPFAAPGRRRLFVDAWLTAVQQAGRDRGCPRAAGPEDFGYSLDDLRALARAAGADLMTALRALPNAAGRSPAKPAGLGALAASLEPVFDWQRGCDALAAGRVAEALAAFEEAARARPAGRIYDLTAIAALARLDRFADAETRLDALAASAGDDPRLGLAAARIGLERPDLERLANDGKDEGLAEEFFFVLLHRKSWTEAARFADKRIERARGLKLPDDLWVEHAGDAAFFLGNDAAARTSYEAALAARPNDRRLLTKLSDVLWRLGDTRGERSCRERVFGTLDRAGR